MKKCIIAVFALLAFAYAQEEKPMKNGFFVGAEIGYGINFAKAQTTNGTGVNATTTTADEMQAPFGNVGLKLGYIHYISKMFGFRGYLTYNYGFSSASSSTKEPGTTTTKTSSLSSLHQFALNADVLFDFYHTNNISLGAFAGIGIGYGSFKQSTKDTGVTTSSSFGDGFVLPINVGLAAGIGKSHRVELAVRIPTIAPKYTDTLNNTEYSYRNLIMAVGYSYTF